MPISTELPPPAIEIEQEYVLPSTWNQLQSYPGVGVNILSQLAPRGVESLTGLPSTLAGANALTGYSGVAVGPRTIQYDVLHGRHCCSIRSTGILTDRTGDSWRPPDWLPAIGDPAALAPGARLLPGAVCAWFDFYLAVGLAGGAPSWPDDTTGVFFLPNDTPVDTIPGVAATADVEGFGLFCNADGAGGARWEYVSWGAGAPGPILERLPIVASVTDWSTVRVVFQSARSGREGNIRVVANGAELVARDFGTAVLRRLDTSFPATTGPVQCIMVGGGGDRLFYAMTVRQSRYTPEGEELQEQ